MNFYPRRRKSAPAIIIISLIDVLLVMLVFLLFTTTLKNTPAVRIELPETGEASRAGASNEKPPMIVSIRREAPQFFLGERPLQPDQLKAELKTAQQADPSIRLQIRADTNAAWVDVLKVLTLARQSSITNIKALTKASASGAR